MHRDSPRAGKSRSVGWWAYDVPEFAVTHYPVENGFRLDAGYIATHHDIIIWEDHAARGTFTRRGDIPIAYVVVDSTLSENHYKSRVEEAQQADLILVDHDRLERFEGLGIPVRRLGYAVNDNLYYDYGESKAVDVCLHCNWTAERIELHEFLREFCAKMGYMYAAGRRIGKEYALAFNRAKICVNLARNTDNRPHRVFDVMASRSALLTSPLPAVDGEEGLKLNEHYWTWADYKELALQIDIALASGLWRQVSDAAYEFVHRNYVWRVVARRLRETLAEVFPQFGSG